MIRKLIVLFSCFILALFVGLSSVSAHSTNKTFIIINKATNKLAFYQNNKLVKVFPVATGKKRSYTPEGTFTIVNKIKNRPYYKKRIPGGDPRNPLGARWLGLSIKGGNVYGIHGTNNPKSIGKYASSGCIRMYNQDVKWLYKNTPLKTKVIITYSSKSFHTIAKKHGYKIVASKTK
jgi:lipoprotein-anchoring transpeptidase ErfK/SrfK